MKKMLIVLATAAILVPAAQAENRIVSPDDRAFSRAPALERQTLGPDDRPLPRSTVDIRESSKPVQVIVRQSHGFDWGDAATGAAATGGLAAILAALVLLAIRSRRTGRPQTASTVGSA